MVNNKYVNFARKNKFKASKVRYDREEKSLVKSNGSREETETFSSHPPKSKRPKLHIPVHEEEQEIERLRKRYDDKIEAIEAIETFQDFPFSKKTLAGLAEANFTKPTIIQRECILPALFGKDILAAAKTGSGKTLAFVIPVLERLFVEKWSSMDGLGALIITPTRELAVQIYETTVRVGRHHDFNIGLLIGGQNLKYERNRLHNLNIIIGTPGRLLQHMDQNPLFDTTNMKILVLDEADRCLDMGFSSTMDSIIENLPEIRQTLLFSATQTSSVRDLARVNLVKPVTIAPHEHEQIATPAKLHQSYVVVELADKLTMLWSFLYTHPKQKIIIFFATCKQVKYFYQILRKLRPASLLLPLYGGMNQEKRNKIYSEFCNKKTNVCLLATDVASRGLDFPKVNWVVQMDCPEDVVQYIHRAGRTARLNTSGENLLVLLPHEASAMLDSLEKSKIPIKEIQIDERQLFSPLPKIQSFLAQYPDLKESAKRAFVAYIKSIALMTNKEIFQLQKLNLDDFAKSLGLSITPRVRFFSRALQREQNLPLKKSNYESRITTTSNEGNDSSDEDQDANDFLRLKQNVSCSEGFASNEQKPIMNTEAEGIKTISRKRKSKVKLVKKSLKISNRTVFDENGTPLKEEETQTKDVFDLNEARLRLEQQDADDKKRYKAIKKAKRISIKEKERKLKANDVCAPTDDFGSESDNSVCLDWLPDPDKVYGKNKIQNDSDYDEVSNNPKKLDAIQRKRGLLHNTQTLSLNDAEQLAMKLLM
uniref:ATP-dependent RNA helicase n=1 Tax=Anopheles epiroticus TaxID=199890 RepID=A0A240PLY5_9DIPT